MTTYKEVCAILINHGSGWQILNDANHESENALSVVQDSVSVTLNYAFTAQKVVASNLQVDDAFSSNAGGGPYHVGPSIGLSSVSLYFYDKNGVLVNPSTVQHASGAIIVRNKLKVDDGGTPPTETVVWDTVFSKALPNSLVGDGWTNYTVRETIPHNQLNLSALPAGKTYTKARVTLAASATEGCVYGSVGIGNKATTGDVWDCSAALTPLKFGGASGFTAGNGVDKVTDDTAFTYGGNGVVVAIACPSGNAAHDGSRYDNIVGCTRSYSAPGPDTVAANPSLTYYSSNDQLEFVTKIEFGYVA